MLKKEILSLIEARIDISRVNLKYFTQRLGDFATTVYTLFLYARLSWTKWQDHRSRLVFVFRPTMRELCSDNQTRPGKVCPRNKWI